MDSNKKGLEALKKRFVEHRVAKGKYTPEQAARVADKLSPQNLWNGILGRPATPMKKMAFAVGFEKIVEKK